MVGKLIRSRDSLGFLVWKVSRRMANELSARFAEAGIDISVEQWRALIPLFKLDGLTQGRLCKILSQEKTGVSRLLSALEKRGLVRREISKEDRRVKFLYITDAGRELIQETMGMAIVNHEDIVKDIDPEELRICKRVLWRLVKPVLGDDFFLEE